MAGSVYWVERSAVAPRPAADRVGRRADRRRPDAARSAVRSKRRRSCSPAPRSRSAATGSFDFFKSRIGLTQSDSLRLGSPFDYRRQVELILLDGMPDPAERDRYERASIDMIRRYVARTDGHAFVLFTSYDMMRRVAAGLGRLAGGEESGALFARPTECRGT